jgi:hypothetical protein
VNEVEQGIRKLLDLVNTQRNRITDLEAQIAAADRLAEAAKATWAQACLNHDQDPPTKYMAPFGGLVQLHDALAAFHAARVQP